MRHTLQGPPLFLPADRPKRVRSGVDLHEDGRVSALTLRLVVDHTDPTDLSARVIAPDGHTWEVPRAKLPQMAALPVPEGLGARGRWTVEVDDVVAGDGGAVTWSLDIETDAASPFRFELEFIGPWSESQRGMCERGARRWEPLIVASLEPARLASGRLILNHLITFEAKMIDGPGGILGQSGPEHLRWETDLPITSRQTLDIDDRDELADEGRLETVVTHEAGHGLGEGTIWQIKSLLLGATTSATRFVGEGARREYGLLRRGSPQDVPAEDQGGPGTRDGHWRESVFDNELMTGWLDRGANPLSRMTAASLGDLGYQVDPDAADPYSLPAAVSGEALRIEGRRLCGVRSRPEPVMIGGPS